MTNKEQILRNLEYVGVGINTLKMLMDNGKNQNYIELFEEWYNMIFNTMELIKEDYEECQGPLKSLR